MNALKALRALGPVDLRGIRRDSMLTYIALMPIVLALVLRFAVPWIRDQVFARGGFDIAPFYFLLMSYFFVMLSSALVGMAVGFLVLDERDNQTLQALQVSPLPMRDYIVYRVSVPLVVSVLMTLAAYPLAGLGNLSLAQQLVVALSAALLAPLWMLFLASFAANKVQGFALLKAAGFIVLMLPMFAYFVKSGWHWAFGLLPSFWPVKIYWLFEAGETRVWPYLLIGILFQSILLLLLLRQFLRAIRQQS
ncbi:MAG TPA: hypothetical protein PLC52_03045 [Anaerolineales bacterium]|nr:hypothetical protein [Anaerolineales bacterium]HRQ91830.1 hypothetical protein [Anaerolineales bacterium]